MKLWGLTGLAGSGKSTALKILEQHGFPVLDTDQVARQVVDPQNPLGAAGLARVVAHFGSDYLLPDGSLNRRKLRERILNNPAEQRALELILHPLIVQRVKEWAEKLEAQGVTMAFVEGTRLIESGFHKELHSIILLTAPSGLRKQRLMTRDHLSKEQCEALVAAQNEEVMRQNASHEWSNGGNPKDLEIQILNFLTQQQENNSNVKGNS